ncbi:MAG: thioredoxin domain-containing protein [Planctomycetota bacterium]
MKNTLSRTVAPAIAALTIAVAGIAFAQSGSQPSGTPAPKATQPGSDSKPSGSAQAHAAEAPKIIAVNFYADWCPGCKALKPKLEEAMKDAASQPCLTVKLDQTDKDSHQAEYMLAALGLGDLWKEHAGKTGYVLLVDAKTHKVVSTITSMQETKEIKTTLMAALMH